MQLETRKELATPAHRWAVVEEAETVKEEEEEKMEKTGRQDGKLATGKRDGSLPSPKISTDSRDYHSCPYGKPAMFFVFSNLSRNHSGNHM